MQVETQPDMESTQHHLDVHANRQTDIKTDIQLISVIASVGGVVTGFDVNEERWSRGI